MGRECLLLSPGDWQAFPLHTKQIGVPHKVRVRVPSDRAMNLAISIQEPDAGGVTGGVRLDSGITVEPMGINGTSADFLDHDLVFWPRTAKPFLLLFITDLKEKQA
ncbi:MAG: hypothetical protein U0892_01780 [Pirellulales bacterium]